VQKCGIFSTGQFGLGLVLPRFDQALSALLEDLGERGLLGQTLVVVVGEFGRTPRIAANPYPGRDHGPACYAALLAGAGVRAGLVHGASDKKGGYVKDAPVSPEDFGATLLHALGVPPGTRLSPDGGTQPASTGRPLVDLFG
jgi:arylsulfatase A-like enzyme